MSILTRIASGLLALDQHTNAYTSRFLSGAARLNTRHAEALANKADRKRAASEANARRLAESRREQAHRQLALSLQGINEQFSVDLERIQREAEGRAQAATSYEAVGSHCFAGACVRDERAAVLKGIREELRSNV
jgi:F0F1-type ATP synthase membrane subunit b/b'